MLRLHISLIIFYSRKFIQQLYAIWITVGYQENVKFLKQHHPGRFMAYGSYYSFFFFFCFLFFCKYISFVIEKNTHRLHVTYCQKEFLHLLIFPYFRCWNSWLFMYNKNSSSVYRVCFCCKFLNLLNHFSSVNQL